ncbi:MAG: hypothetical protein FWB88_01995 [Defluviitaleaceae bacterium]|nr:hypothetical protein [Defluviitaleaceae bacterium]MCL2238863.1 hypothetical protein [Defluviitaleaceae bacterium]
MIILSSAKKHNISDEDMLAVVSDPHIVLQLMSEPEKLLFLGFDSKARALEVITDTGADGQIFIIHADKVTKQYQKLFRRQYNEN